jgi:hypothetical protein
MSKLLKGKRVFIDTQVFRKARFGVASPAFKKLAAISKDRGVILITTSITKREIEAQIDEIAPEIKTAFGRAASLLLGFGLPELIIRGSTASTFSETQVATLLKEFMADFFRDCSVEEIALPKDALSNTLDLYFQKRPPFGNAKKKSEFPDAFVLEALKSKAGVNGESVYVISEDPDLEAACKESPYLEHLPSVAHFLDLWNLHSNTIKQVRATLRDNSSRIHNELDRIVESISGEMDTPGVVEMSHRKIADILDELVISCDASKAWDWEWIESGGKRLRCSNIAASGVHQTCRTRCQGGAICPPFESLGQLRVALAHVLEITLRICRIGERGNHIGDDKPPFVVVDGAANFLPLKQCDSLLGVLFCVAHG